jgi:putative transposase
MAITRCTCLLRTLLQLTHTLLTLLYDGIRFLDQRIRNLGLRVLQTPPQTPQANALCERLIGTLRRECLDCVIPLTENHIRYILQEWLQHYNAGRPHRALGLGIPLSPVSLSVLLQAHRYRLLADLKVVAQAVLGGWHHEYGLEQKAG